MKSDRIAEGINQSVDRGAQSAARAPDRRVLVGYFLGASTVLKGANYRAVDDRVLAVGICGGMLNSAATRRIWATAESPVSVLTGTLRQVTQGNACSITMEHGLDGQAVVCCGYSDGARSAGQQGLSIRSHSSSRSP
jgi:hypothetical protein